MKKLCFVMFCLSLMLGRLALAEEARLDVSGRDSGIEVANVSASENSTGANPSWIADEAARKRSASFQTPVTKEAWTTATYKFTPKADGELRIDLQGNFSKAEHVWVYFDDIKVTGATIKNGDFEETNTQGTFPTGWNFMKKDGVSPEYVTEGAASGKGCIKVCQNWRAYQMISVKKDQEVVITLQVKFAGSEERK
ncbi:MAG: hypothetical protein JXR97_03180 [Planctomycetes bacterium]|nr:hypothetical protein [Planctomycetota bacterium]